MAIMTINPLIPLHSQCHRGIANVPSSYSTMPVGSILGDGAKRTLKPFALDRQRKQLTRTVHRKSEHLAAGYGRQLRQIAKQVGFIIGAYDAETLLNNPIALSKVQQSLRHYAESLNDWAWENSKRLFTKLDQEDRRYWFANADQLSKGLADLIANSDVGSVFQQFQAEQVRLIKSIPLDAAKRVHEISTKAMVTGGRWEELARQIQESGHVTASRATLIARTETSRAQTNLMQARAMKYGSDGYIWQTANDYDVRPSHKRMQGKFIKWTEPPTLDRLTGHAGALPNCRCFPEPIF